MKKIVIYGEVAVNNYLFCVDSYETTAVDSPCNTMGSVV